MAPGRIWNEGGNERQRERDAERGTGGTLEARDGPTGVLARLCAHLLLYVFLLILRHGARSTGRAARAVVGSARAARCATELGTSSNGAFAMRVRSTGSLAVWQFGGEWCVSGKLIPPTRLIPFLWKPVRMEEAD